MRTFLVSTAIATLLWSLGQQLNHYLSEWHLNVFISGLIITFPSLRLEHSIAWKSILFLGLLSDATAPVPFGSHAFLFLLSHAIVHKLRQRFPEHDMIFSLTCALAVNTALMLALTLALGHRAPDATSLWSPVLINSLLSSAVIVLIAPWTFALHLRALELAGANPRNPPSGRF